MKKIDFSKIIPYKELTMQWYEEHPRPSRFSREEALAMARDYGLEDEVMEAIDRFALTPDEALQEWDLYPFG